jgi:hypothetical protein
MRRWIIALASFLWGVLIGGLVLGYSIAAGWW